jgi:histidine triad (HIT) family protein
MDCIFCKIIAGQIPSVKIYEDDRTFAFMDINPRSDGHCLVIPKKHAVSLFDIEEEELKTVMATLKKVALAIKGILNPDGMTSFQLNGRAANQIVDHFHVHLVPRWVDDGVDLRHGLQPGDMEKIKAVGVKIAAALNDS